MAFADASFGNLEDLGSIESGLVTMSRPIARNGPVKCVGHVIHFYSREIHRICRSSIASECISIANLIDFLLWYKGLITEVLNGVFEHQSISATDPLPLLSPFKEEDPEQPIDVSEMRQFLIPPSNTRQALWIDRQTQHGYLSSFCKSCNLTSYIALEHIRNGIESSFVTADQSQMHCLLLTDCSNCFAAIHNINVHCSDRATKLQMCYIRDAQKWISISFICGPFNLADTGTKWPGNLALFKKMAETGKFEIAFLTRKECKQLLDSREIASDRRIALGKIRK